MDSKLNLKGAKLNYCNFSDASLQKCDMSNAKLIFALLKNSRLNSSNLKDVLLKIINPGDTVLFSCGGASFNDFENYEERGRFFKDIVLNIKKEING